MNLESFNQLDINRVKEYLFQCCGSTHWVEEMIASYPFENEQHLIRVATNNWYDKCQKKDYLESFTHHPKIGDFNSLKQKFAGNEQASITEASIGVIRALAEANSEYESKNGFIFIVCATGKSAAEMLQIINARLQHNAEEELAIAMGEQHKITLIRLKKLLPQANWQWLRPSHLTTHILDTSVGKPGKDIEIKLQALLKNNWKTIALGVTNSDGRVPDLLPSEKDLPKGTYKLIFNTGLYFKKQKIKGFYPSVEIQFFISGTEHYHVPLLINPYGYSTYRGS